MENQKISSRIKTVGQTFKMVGDIKRLNREINRLLIGKRRTGRPRNNGLSAWGRMCQITACLERELKN